MSLIRWEPFTSSDDAIDRLMPQLFGRWPRVSFDTDGGKVEWRPRADISETEGEFLIRAELPAVKKEDVKVTFDDGLPWIHQSAVGPNHDWLTLGFLNGSIDMTAMEMTAHTPAKSSGRRHAA